MNSKAAAYLDLIFSNILFGANLAIYSTLVKNHLPSEILFYLQLSFAALVFLPFLLFDKRFRITLADAKQLTLIAVVIIFGGLYLTILGTSYTTATDAGIITLVGPVFTIIIQKLLVRRRLSSLQNIGVIIALSAVIYLIFREFHSGKSLGNAIITFAVLFISLNTVLIKPLNARLGVMNVMGWYFLFAWLIATPIFLHRTLDFDFSMLSTSSYLDIAYAMIIGTVPPSFLLYKGTAILTPMHAAIFRCFRPVIAMCIAIFRGQEKFSWHSVVVGIIILLGLILVIELLRKWQDTSQLKDNQKSAN